MSNNWLETDMLEDYLDGKLDAKAMHFIERIALEDPFVSDALEGLRQSPRRKQSISILQRQLKQRLEIQPEKRKVWRITTHRLSIGATAAVLFIAASVIFWMQETNKRQKRREVRQVEVNIAPEASAPEASAKNTATVSMGAASETAASETLSASELDANKASNLLGYTVYPQFTADVQQVFAPVGGWAKFRKYIIAKNQLLAFPIQHSLTVTFGIDSKGRPTAIKIDNVRELKYSKEAIRLLKEGPGWELLRTQPKQSKDVSIEIYF